MDDCSLIELVENARGGCRQSLDKLSSQVQSDLYSYIYRLTLSEDATNDIRQETLLQMYQSLKDLQKPDRFRPWLYKIAWTKTRNHYRSLKNKNHMSLNDADHLVDALKCNSAEGIKTLVSNEIAETLVKSISALDIKQRTVLVLRCYEDLSYSEIANVLNCSQTTARVLFFRAKHNLKSDLRKKGIVTNSMFLGLLGSFGKATSPAKQAVNVSASSLEIGTIAAAIGFLSSKAGMILISFIMAGIIITGIALNLNTVPDAKNQNNETNRIKSFHYIMQAWENSYLPNANLDMGKSLSRGGYEQWYFFPEGVNGPLFKMSQRWDPSITNKQCGWLLNGDGLKYYHSGRKTIYLENSNYCGQKTLRFPCDSVEFTNFLDKIEGKDEGVEYKIDPKTGLRIKLWDNRFANAKNFSSDISFNKMDEKTFDSFRYKWPDAAVVDMRDEIHKLGWTSFTLNGTINGTAIHGLGRMPFVYNTSKEYPPLLQLHIGTQKVLIDCPTEASILNSTGKTLRCHPAGTFFKAFMRPWFGMHTLDVIRRDAAQCRIPFKIEVLDYDESIFGYRKWQVTLHEAPGYPDKKVSLLVDTLKDRIESVRFFDNDVCTGTLQLSYPLITEDMVDTINMPVVTKSWFTKERPLQTLWFFELMEQSGGE